MNGSFGDGYIGTNVRSGFSRTSVDHCPTANGRNTTKKSIRDLGSRDLGAEQQQKRRGGFWKRGGGAWKKARIKLLQKMRGAKESLSLL